MDVVWVGKDPADPPEWTDASGASLVIGDGTGRLVYMDSSDGTSAFGVWPRLGSELDIGCRWTWVKPVHQTGLVYRMREWCQEGWK